MQGFCQHNADKLLQTSLASLVLRDVQVLHNASSKTKRHHNIHFQFNVSRISIASDLCFD